MIRESELLTGLNDHQRVAVEHFEGPILVLAGAGSGKTRVLTRRIAHLVLAHRVDPASILAVTFTNKAAGEMRERVQGLIGEMARRAWVSTFHSTSLRILRRHAVDLGYPADFVVYDSDDVKNVMAKILRERNIDIKKNPPQSYLKRFERFKTDYLGPEAIMSRVRNSREQEIAELYQAYQNELIMSGAMDFTDLLFNIVRLFDQNAKVLDLYRRAFRFILVDEFQDTNPIQYRFLRQLSELHQNVLVVGDDDQSIYAFRGANPQSMADFKRDYADVQVVKLEENYRSTQVILDTAHKIIERNSVRMKKKLWTRQEGGELITTYVGNREYDEARYVATQIKRRIALGVSESEIAIFYRTNAQSRALEEALVHAAIPYKVFGGLRFFDRKEIKDILAYLRLMINPRDSQALIRIINTPPRGIGPKGVQQVVEVLPFHGGDCFVALREVGAGNQAIGKFYAMLDEFRSHLGPVGVGSLVEKIVEQTGYIKKLTELKDYTAQSRIENLRELQGIATEMEAQFENPFEQVSAILDRAALMASDESVAPEDPNDQKKYVSLMTLHLAKGLEFDCVFFTGLEAGLIPHYLAGDTPDGVEEERRLAYVGITRARKKLFLTRCESRTLFTSKQGVRPEERFRSPSPFLYELPVENLDQEGGDFAESRTYEVMMDDFDMGGYSALRSKVTTPVSQVIAGGRISSAQQNLLLNQVKPAANVLVEPVELEALSPAVEVHHEVFGIGRVENVEILPDNPADSKVTVFFEKLGTSKRLVYRWARLTRAH